MREKNMIKSAICLLMFYIVQREYADQKATNKSLNRR